MLTHTLPLLKRGLLATVLLAGIATTADAGQIRISGHTDYRDGTGGEFNVRGHDAAGAALIADALTYGYFFAPGSQTVGSANGTKMFVDNVLGFQTFCIEMTEHIALDGIYDAQISTGALSGGVGGVDPDGAGPLPKTDLISVGTAYLYSNFATGQLPTYTYTNGAGRGDDAELLQQAIWYLEDELSLTSSQKAANRFLTNSVYGALTLFGDGTGVGVGGAKANNTLYNVGVLNLSSSTGGKQDQLINLPDGGVTSMLLGLALGGLAVLRRKI